MIKEDLGKYRGVMKKEIFITRKRYLGVCMLYAFVLLLLFASLMRGQTLNGSGTEIDPYQIYNGADLRLMQGYTTNSHLTAPYFALQNDIDLSAYSNWQPLNYNGNVNTSNYFHLDGQNYTISNFNIDTVVTVGSTVKLGLFDNFGGNSVISQRPHIYNLIISESKIKVRTTYAGTHLFIGFIVGDGVNHSDSTTMRRIYIDSTCVIDAKELQYSHYNIGGMAGEGSGSQLYSEAQMYVTHTSGGGTRVKGGIFGYADGSTTSSSFSELGWNGIIVDTIHTVSGSVNRYVGGIVGSGSGDTLRNCFSIGKFGERNYYRGGILGHNWRSKITNSYSDIDSMGGNIEVSGYITGHLDDIQSGETNQENVFFTKRNSGVLSSKMYFHGESASNWDTVGTHQLIDSIKSQSFLEAAGWDFTNIWRIGSRLNGRPYFQWMDELLPSPIVQEITITAPADGSIFEHTDSTLVTWTSVESDTVIVKYGYYVGHPFNSYTWVSLNDTVKGGLSSMMHLSHYLGTDRDDARLRVIAYLNGESTDVYDEIQFKVVSGSQLEINSTVVNGREVTLNTDAGSIIDTVVFYVGNDTTSMSYLGKSVAISPNGNYTYTLPDGFYTSGSYFYKVTNNADTSSYVDLEEPLVGLGIPKSHRTNICWYNRGTSNIGINREHDGGCRWVGSYTFYFHNFLFNTEVSNGKDTLFWVYKTRECQHSCRIDPLCKFANCTNAYNDYYVNVYDTLTSTNDSIKTNMISELSYATPYEYGNRRYYKRFNKIYYDNLITNQDSILIRELPADDYWNATLRFIQYNIPNDLDTLYTDGTSSGRTRALTELNEPKLMLYRDEYFGWSYIDAPKKIDALIQDIYQTAGAITFYKDFFRGIHPKITK